jgi:hypothetical protein
LLVADRRNESRQQYCGKPACRKASKAASQRKWNAKEENKEYFRGPENVERVRAWRMANPGYWRRGKQNTAGRRDALQETLMPQSVGNEKIARKTVQDALQDVCPAQNPLFVGLVANMSGLALQEDIAELIAKLFNRGEDILRIPRGGLHTQTHETQNHTVPGAPAARASPV